jgi:hypothetical protein
MTDINKVKSISAKFRKAIKECKNSELPLSLSDFPVGSCSDASMLLGTYLKINGFGDFNFVKGKRGKGDALETHYWLQQENMIVDITADQYDGIDDEIIITSVDSEWHNSFDQEIIQEADYRMIDANDVRKHLNAVFKYIVQSKL